MPASWDDEQTPVVTPRPSLDRLPWGRGMEEVLMILESQAPVWAAQGAVEHVGWALTLLGRCVTAWAAREPETAQRHLRRAAARLLAALSA